MKLFAVSLFTLGVISSFVFCLFLLILLYVDQIDIGLAIGLTIGANLLFWLIGPRITDWINKFFYKTTFLTKEQVAAQYPAIAELINHIATEHKFPFPKVGIIPDNNPTAFSYGSGRFNSRVVLTQGIFHFLSPEEVNAVVAHEMGHIVNRDFIVMMIASTFVQIIYEIYSVLIRARGKKSGNAKIIALVAYALYIVATYILLFLSRTREYLADEFSARQTSPQALATSLIKIAYGIVTVDDTDSAKHLLQSTRHLGIIDVKNAKNVGMASYITSHDDNALAEVMVFDKISPWAKLIELNSTHPLTGKRLDHLSTISKETNKPFAYDITAAIARLQINMSRLYEGFAIGIGIYFAPIITGLAFFLILPLQYLPLGIALGLLIQLAYKFPKSQTQETTILEAMRNPYASPLRGQPITLHGKVIGRGIAGYVFSEDMMYQDNTGLIFLDYNSLFGFVGDFFFALKKLKNLFDIPSTATGWYFRSMSSSVSLKSLRTDKDTIKSHPIIWSLIIPLLLMGLTTYLIMTIPPGSESRFFNSPYWQYLVNPPYQK